MKDVPQMAETAFSIVELMKSTLLTVKDVWLPSEEDMTNV